MNTQTKIALEQAKKAANRGDRRRARTILREAARRDPNSEEIYMLFAKVAQKREHAIQCYERVLSINPNNYVALEALERLQLPLTPMMAPPRRPQIPQGPPAFLQKFYQRFRRLKFKAAAINIFRFVLTVVVIVGGVAVGIIVYTKFFPSETGASTAGQESQPSSQTVQDIPTVLEVQWEYATRIQVQEGNPADFEPVWDLITIDDIDPIAQPSTEKPQDWYDASITMTVNYLYPHQVKLRFAAINPVTSVVNPIVVEKEILPNSALGLEPGMPRQEKFAFYQWSHAESPASHVEVGDAEILRIDDNLEGDWTPPEAERFFYRDIWLITNPHSEAIPLYWEFQKLDEQGQIVDTEEYSYCAKSEDEYLSLFREASYLPPGEVYILAKDLTAHEADAGMQTNLIMRPLQNCQPTSRFGVTPDSSVVLKDLVQDGSEISFTIENQGSGEGFGLIYVNTYDSDGNPINGQIVVIASAGLPLDPGESIELTKTIYLLPWLDPKPDRYEFVFLGLSR